MDEFTVSFIDGKYVARCAHCFRICGVHKWSEFEATSRAISHVIRKHF